MKDNVKKILSIVLGVALLVSIIPAALLIRNGGKDSPTDVGAMPEGKEFISMPITIRDFAADGMLFEFNQFEDPDDYYSVKGSKLKAFFTKADFTGGLNQNTNYTDGYRFIEDDTVGDYWRYYADSTGDQKLTFSLKNLGYTRDEVDYVIVKFRMSNVTNGAPKIANRGPDASKSVTAPDDDNQPPLYQLRNFHDHDAAGKLVTWSKLSADSKAADEWHYFMMHPDEKGNDNPDDLVTYISIYTRMTKGHFDFGGLWVFGSKANALACRDNDYKHDGVDYYNGDNKGYGMLTTDGNDYYNCLPSTSNNIAGSNLYSNGSWGDASEPDAIEATLNSGTKQYVHGAAIRTNLVGPYLDKDGKPAYTDATITYLQDLMKETLAVSWEATPATYSSTAYNLFYVQGTKLYNDALEYVGPGDATATKDLAQLLREKINGNDGTLEETKEKAAAGNLTVLADIATYYDAAYYLLHNTWRDSAQDTATTNDGYGMPIPAYNKLNLIQTTNSKGEKCYVFNSGYDNSVYDTADGVIYNTQVTTMTKVQDTTVHKTGIIRGMIMPEARFNPIDQMGYGNCGNTNAVAGQRTDGWNDTYYAETNYNLSLEGHAEFIYYQDANQYFTFTGDDDVYLYLNGTRVLDVGAAHSISKVSINLNDVAQKLGLVDGQVYDFDFFYMERHGTAANFGIETNIQIVDPAMTTTKTGYQNGLNTGYNGYVDPDVPMVYDFALQNKGEESIKNLAFTDDKIGVALTTDTITLSSDTAITDLSLTLYNSDGTVKSSVAAGSLTDATLKQYLATGLAVGEKIVIYGFKYTVPEDEWETREYTDANGNTVTSNAYFYNMVNTTATSESGQNLGGLSHWVVQKQRASYEDIHLYTWGNMDTASTDKTKLKDASQVTLSREELDDKITVNLNSGDIKISNATGITDPSQTTNINSKATVSDDTITYKTTNTGADTFYVMVGTHGPIRVTVYTYGATDSTFVLDYNLPVTFTKDVLNSNSVVDLASQNPFGTTYSRNVTTGASTYGTFGVTSGNVEYKMEKIMNGADSTQGTVKVLETGATTLTKFTGVEMPQTITVVPASVMYYEDNFIGTGALTYVGGWKQFGTGFNYQSADQEMNYGSDLVYSEDKEAPAMQMGDAFSLLGDISNGTIRVHTVQNTNEPYDLMTFTFQGTGFEILSRTTDKDYCIMAVDVKKTNYSTDSTEIIYSTAYYSNGDAFTKFPVICESENGDLYQVPVISVKDLEYGTYTVTLSVSYNGSATNTPRAYIDGVRIYSPLTDEDELKYYSSDEARATITEVKKLIGDKKVVYAAKASNGNYTLAYGDTAIENYGSEDGFVLKETVDLQEYLNFGPNNELYLDGQNDGFSVIAFYVTPDTENYTDAERTIQIGVHRKTDSLNGDVVNNTDSVTFVYGSDSNALTNASNATTVRSGTEQYYTIDVKNLTKDANGRYLVIIGMSSNNVKGVNPVLSITNLKLSGYTISPIDFALQPVAQNG